MRTMKNDSNQPAVPTTHANRTNRMMPNMFWMHGKNTPIIVPSFRFYTQETYMYSTLFKRNWYHHILNVPWMWCWKKRVDNNICEYRINFCSSRSLLQLTMTRSHFLFCIANCCYSAIWQLSHKCGIKPQSPYSGRPLNPATRVWSLSTTVSLLNRFHTGHDHCGAWQKWHISQTITSALTGRTKCHHSADSCLVTKLDAVVTLCSQGCCGLAAQLWHRHLATHHKEETFCLHHWCARIFIKLYDENSVIIVIVVMLTQFLSKLGKCTQFVWKSTG